MKQLQEIQKHFHALIMERAGRMIRESNVTLPELTPDISGEEKGKYFAVPGMYGGFHYWLEGEGDSLKLVTRSWCRIIEGSGQHHEITTAGTTLIAQGFV